MVRKAAATSGKSPVVSGDGRTGKASFAVEWPLSGRQTALAVAILATVVAVSVGVTREAMTIRPEATSATQVRAHVGPPKPALTRAEELYIQALWPIHAEVERTTARVSLGKILYTTSDLTKADLKARMDAALATYRLAEERIGTLQPPPRLARNHEEYLAAVRLFQQSAVESMKLFEDGNDDHLLAAYPLSQQGSNKIREVGVAFWQDEYPAN